MRGVRFLEKKGGTPRAVFPLPGAPRERCLDTPARAPHKSRARRALGREVSVEARPAQIHANEHATPTPLRHTHPHVCVAVRSGVGVITKDELFHWTQKPDARLLWKEYSFETKQTHPTQTNTSPISNRRQGGSETDMLSSTSNSATSCSHPLWLPGVGEQWARPLEQRGCHTLRLSTLPTCSTSQPHRRHSAVNRYGCVQQPARKAHDVACSKQAAQSQHMDTQLHTARQPPLPAVCTRMRTYT
ncbi:uncharacterized protein LOC129032555 [Pongo pygmaeus]|uniref:uncharacterized protein LOC129032555 n=1 Tax=Pongo pygmaeus TaxID=9600 RepID=UPI0023E263A0|nr:uncharacterized protein LOC129032555 [Pongo pygmaeus]